jgi:hypothetical protein
MASRKKLALTVLTAALLSSCASRGWGKYGASGAEIARDKFECQKESRIVAYPQIAPPAPQPSFAGGFAQGWTLGQSIVASQEANKLYSLCMEARGYRYE